MHRRTLLKALAIGAPLASSACQRAESSAVPRPQGAGKNGAPRMPVLFLAHGSPTLMDDSKWAGELAAWAKALPRPRAVLMLSAHWVEAPVTLSATRTVPLVYDFYGFPERYYQVQYPAPGAPELAARLRGLLAGEPVRESERGLDHGAYVPLACLYPQADVPVLQASLPSLDPKRLFALGRALAPLRDKGVLIVGSGFLTHNLRALDLRVGSPPPAWAREFDAWAADALTRSDVDALLDFQRRAPAVELALPNVEHYLPVLCALGAASSSSAAPQFPIQGFAYGSMTRRSVQWG